MDEKRIVAKFEELKETSNAAACRRDNGFTYALLGQAVRKGSLRNIVDIKFYQTNKRCYCVLTINDSFKGFHISGGGYVNGGGFHRPSGALQEALNNAGVKLNRDIHGVGEGAMAEAIEAIMIKMGFRNTYLTKVLA